MTVNFNAIDTEASELTEAPLGPPSAEPLSGEILTRSKVLHRDEDQGIVSGIWECEPGTSRWTFDDRGEFIYVVAGHMTVTEDGGQDVELRAGQSALFPKGWAGNWTVHETLRKSFIVYR